MWEGTAGSRITWKRNKFERYWTDPTARLVDPLYLLSLNEPPRDDLNVDIHPYDPDRGSSQFSGFTYILPCPRLVPGSSVLVAQQIAPLSRLPTFRYQLTAWTSQ